MGARRADGVRNHEVAVSPDRELHRIASSRSVCEREVEIDKRRETLTCAIGQCTDPAKGLARVFLVTATGESSAIEPEASDVDRLARHLPGEEADLFSLLRSRQGVCEEARHRPVRGIEFEGAVRLGYLTPSCCQ